MGLVPCTHARAAQGGGWSVGKRAVGGPLVPLLLPHPTFPLLSPLLNLTANCPLTCQLASPAYPSTRPTNSKSPPTSTRPTNLVLFLGQLVEEELRQGCDARVAVLQAHSHLGNVALDLRQRTWKTTLASYFYRPSSALNARWSQRHCPLPALHWHCYVLTPTTRRPLPLPTNTTGGS